jgi:polyisoprenyl-phosphate glycosyltransferase
MATRLALMPETWNHLAAAVLRSRVRVVGVPTERGHRFAGDSSTNLAPLLAHGLGAIAVLSDIVFVRRLILVSTVPALALALATGPVTVRIATDLAIPDWASNVVGISAITLFQVVTLSVVASLTMFASRSGAVFIPAFHAGEFIAERVTLARKCPPHHKTSNISALS